MKSLQIVVPFQTCPFHCPFCIANNPKVETAFVNLYESDKDQYFRLLASVLNNNRSLRTVVLTGDTEPTLNMRWLVEVAQFVKFNNPNIQIELQTKNTNQRLLRQLVAESPIDVYGFSVDTLKQFHQVKEITFINKPRIKRLTLLLNDRLDIARIDEIPGIKQVTIKYLQYGDNPEINGWIMRHEWRNTQGLLDFIERFKYQATIFIDKNCMASEGRYQIFRSDGFLYKTWTDLPK